MLYLSKEATAKDQKLKMQMLLSTDNDTKNTEFVWKHNWFFGSQKGELTLFKKGFPWKHAVLCQAEDNLYG